MSIDLSTVGDFEFERGYEGQSADLANTIRRSRICETAAGIGWGKPVAQGVGAGVPGGCVLVDSSHLQLVGIAEKNPMHPLNGGVAKYAQYDAVSVIEEGPVFIMAAENARDGDQVIVIAASATFGSSQGGVANESTRLTFPFASYEGAAVAGKICKIILRGSRTIRATT